MCSFSFEFQILLQKKPFIKLALLKNGYTNRREKNGIHYRNTVSLDVVLYIIACYCVDSEPFKQYWDSVGTFDMKEFMDAFTSKGANDRAYKCRSKILFPTFHEKKVDNLRLVDCDSSISFIIENVIAPLMPSVIIEKRDCKCKIDEHYLFVDIDFGSDIRLLSQAAENFSMINSSELICGECEASCEKKAKLNEIIFINTEKSGTITWEEIPKIITLNGRIYMLAGVVQCIPSTEDDFKPHFASHVLRSNRKWYVFDNSKKEVYQRIDNVVLNTHLLVYLV